jgi:hypothetical protein
VRDLRDMFRRPGTGENGDGDGDRDRDVKKGEGVGGAFGVVEGRGGYVS